MSWHISPCPWLRGTGAGSRTPLPPASHLPQPPMEAEDRGDTPSQCRAHTTSTDIAPCPSSECTAAVSPAGCPQERCSPEPTLPKPLLPAQPGALVPSPATPPHTPAGCPCAVWPGSPFLPPRAEEAMSGALPASPSPAGPTAAATGVSPRDARSPGQGASFSPPQAGWHGEAPSAWRGLRMREKS